MNRSPSPFKARLAKSGFFVGVLTLVSFVGAILALPGCDRTPSVATGPVHTVRGRVVKLPVVGDPSSSFSLFHEEIPQWLRPDGTRGMNAMVMPFPLAKGVSIEGIELGDAVEVSVQQHPAGTLPYEVTIVTKLPPETRLTIPEVGK